MIMNAANVNADEPAARPSRPSVRFTAFAVAYTTSTIQTNSPTLPRSMSSGCVNERCVSVCTKYTASHANAAATTHDAERLAPLAQPEVPPGAHAEVVVDPADDAEPDDEREQRPARRRERDALAPDVREQVADDRRDDDRDAAHRRRAGLGDVRVLDRPVVADLLADARARAAGG